MIYQVFVYQLCFNFSLALIAVTNGRANRLLAEIGTEKGAAETRECFPVEFFFFAPFSINYIPHNYVIPQAMPHAIPQTHSACYPHRFLRRLLIYNHSRIIFPTFSFYSIFV